MTKIPEKKSTVSAFSFFIKACFYGVATFFLANQFASHQLLLVVLSIFVFSIPIYLGGIYSTSIEKIFRLNIFRNKGIIYWLISRRGISILFWICWSIASSAIILVQFHNYSTIQWAVIVLIIPIFYFTFIIYIKILSSELKPYIVNNIALNYSKKFTSFVMVILYFFIVRISETVPKYSSLEKAIDAKKVAAADMTGSTIIMEVGQILAVYQGIESYIIELIGSQIFFWKWLLLALGSFFIFYNACVILSCFLISRVEYRRVFGPLTDEPIPEPLSSSRIAKVTALITFGFLFIYIPTFLQIEELSKTPRISEFRQGTEEFLVPKLEKIGNNYFKQGTIAQIQEIKRKTIRDFDASFLDLELAVDQAFDRLEINADDFLDWYYSLKGEYARIWQLLTGRMEDYLGDKLHEYLAQDDPFNEVQAALDKTLSYYAEAQESFEKQAQEIMANNRVFLPRSEIEIIQQIDLVTLPDHQDLIGLQNRLIAGGGGGAATGLMTAAVVKKVVSKSLGKSTLKIAAKALAKVLTGKAGGAASGAGVGASTGSAIGSAFPVIGTAAGGIIGGIIGGVAGGVAVDKLLLELEEHFNREDFKRELLVAIDETRLEVKGKLAN